MARKWFNFLVVVALLSSLLTALPAVASPPSPDGETPPGGPAGVQTGAVQRSNSLHKEIDRPNAKDYLRMRQRRQLLEAAQQARIEGRLDQAAGLEAQAALLDQSGTDRVLVVLVEFAGADTFTWTQGSSTWDPLGQANEAEYGAYVGDCSKIITQTTVFHYSGPLHNQTPRPLSPEDRSGDSIWTEDFSPEWFDDFMFGSGIVFSYTMQDGTPVYEDFTGQSVADYYSDLSNGIYTVTGDVVGWLGLPHSTWWYGADGCPGARSVPAGVTRPSSAGAIPGAGNARTLVIDALDAVNAISATLPWTFDWHDYDQNGDGVIDRLWIVHAGYGEEEGTVMMNRTDYGESAIWSHSSSLSPQYSVAPGVAAGPYIVMPENGGIGVFAHEYGHNLGAWDLYSYGEGDTSAGFWTLMSDDWTGHPIGYEPPAVDPTHLDLWGWLDPIVINDPSQEYDFYLGQASRFNDNTAPGPVYRGAKIVLDSEQVALPVPVWSGSYYWWSDKLDLSNGMMTSANRINLGGSSSATLSFDIAYNIEDQWDFLWIQVSSDGNTWNTLTNAHTQCLHDPSWIGGQYGFPDDLCAAGIGGFYGSNASWPAHDVETFDLSAYVGQSIWLRFWYMTDWATLYDGAFVDNVLIVDNKGTVFSDDAEANTGKWIYQEPWVRSKGSTGLIRHYYYLQWRNVNDNGGYDSAMGDARWRFGPANTGLLVWYNTNLYGDNEIAGYVLDEPSLGPKGNSLVVDSHPEPYRNPNSIYAFNERGNATSRGLMRDAPFSLQDTVPFSYTDPYEADWTDEVYFEGRPAVNTFNDALSYYPGVELTRLDPASEWNYVTQDWDASTVLPARDPYSVKGPAGYPYGSASSEIIYRYAGAWYFLTSGGANVGSGNPGDENVHYGWRVELLEEGEDHTWARVRVYNALLDVYSSHDTTYVNTGGVYTVTYQAVAHNAGASLIRNAGVVYTLDAALTLVSMVSDPPIGTINMTSWQGDLNPDDTVTLTLTATGMADVDYVATTQMEAYDGEPRGPWSFETVIDFEPIFVLEKTIDNPHASNGDTFNVTLTVSPTVALDQTRAFTITDPNLWPDLLTFTETVSTAPAYWDDMLNAMVWAGSVSPGDPIQSVTFQATVGDFAAIPDGGALFTNTAYVAIEDPAGVLPTGALPGQPLPPSLYGDQGVQANFSLYPYAGLVYIDGSQVVTFTNPDGGPGVVVSPTAAMGNVTVTQRYGQECTINPPDHAVLHCYDIEVESPACADVTFYWDESEDNGNLNPLAWHWNGASWDSISLPILPTNLAGNPRYATYTICDYSPFILADFQPTAITLQSFVAQNPMGVLLVALVLGAMAIGLVIIRRRSA